MAVDRTYVEQWMTVMTSTPRHTLFLQKDCDLVKALETEVKLSASKTNLVDTEMDLKEEIKVFADNHVGKDDRDDI